VQGGRVEQADRGVGVGELKNAEFGGPGAWTTRGLRSIYIYKNMRAARAGWVVV